MVRLSLLVLAFVLLGVLAKVQAEEIEVEVKLVEITPAPTVVKVAPYPRALRSLLYQVQKVHRGKYEDKEILVVRWAIWGREQLPNSEKVGDVERLTLQPWFSVEGYRSERVVNTLDALDLVMYYDPSSRPEPGRAVAAVLDRQENTEEGVVRGEAPGWLFLEEELEHLKTGRFWEKDWKAISVAEADPMAAIVAFRDKLQKLGVTLLLVPIPPKALFYPDELGAGAEPASHADYLKILRREEIDILDLEPAFRDVRQKTPDVQLYCAQDSHWSPAACALTARLIKGHLKHGSEGLPKGVLRREGERRVLVGDLARMLKEDRPEPETLMVDGYRYDHGGPLKLSRPESEIILLGDSHVTVFSEGTKDLHGSGAGLPDHLFALGIESDVIASHGDGVHQARINLYQQRSLSPKYPNYWKGKRRVIWCFSARAFTRAKQWNERVPVVRKRPQR